MKTPEIIFLYRENPKGCLADDWGEQPCEDVDNFAYVSRKHLLDWASDKMSQEQGFEDGEAEYGYRRALEHLVDKLNIL